MAAGIIDHETGTRDIRRLSGLYRFMPITATLAMVAAAAMAGVPLLNGFLSKEMFFAETLDVEGPLPWLDRALPYVVDGRGDVQRRVFAALHPRRVLRSAARRACRAQPHEPPRWMRLPIEVLVLACVVVGMFPAQTIGPLLSVAVAFGARRRHAGVQPCALARLHAAAADERRRAGGRRRAVRRAAPRTSRAGDERTPLLPPIDARRVFDAVLVALSWRWARTLLRWLGTERLQPQLRWLVLLAIAAPLWPVYHLGLELRPPVASAARSVARDRVGGRRRVRGRRGVAGEVPSARRADPRRRRRARHVPHVRLVLRARSRADAADGGDRDDGADAARLALAAEARCRSDRAGRVARARAAAQRCAISRSRSPRAAASRRSRTRR